MNDTQENKLNMYRTVSAVLHNHEPEFAAIPAMVEAREALDGSISLISDLAQAQATENTGITLDKANIQQQMIDTALRVAGAIKAFASVQNDLTLKAQADITKTTFSRARDDMRDDIAQGIHDLAASRMAQLGDYGITAATLSGFQTRIDSYVMYIAKPRTAKSEKTTVTGLLEQEFYRADSIVKDRLDGLVEQFKESGTNLYPDYRNARKIVNTGSRPEPTTPPTPSPTV